MARDMSPGERQQSRSNGRQRQIARQSAQGIAGRIQQGHKQPDPKGDASPRAPCT